MQQLFLQKHEDNRNCSWTCYIHADDCPFVKYNQTNKASKKRNHVKRLRKRMKRKPKNIGETDRKLVSEILLYK